MHYVFTAENQELKAWMEQTAQAMLDRMCELSERPQAQLLGGLIEVLRRQLGKLLAVRRVPKAVPVKKTQPDWV